MKYLFFVLIFISCNYTDNQSKEVSFKNESPKPKNKKDPIKKKVDMTNPALLPTGRDIGRTFNAYYRTGQVKLMLQLLSREVISAYQEEELMKFLSNLDYGYDMTFNSMKNDENSYVLNYTCIIDATKVVKQMDVVIENDTARIKPFDISKGLVFKN